jgi:hypothetical protein
MPIAAVTRLRLRKRRFAPLLLWSALRSLRQSRLADGCLAADVRTTRARAFWTRTLWRDAGAMRAYMRSGAHRLAMRKLPHWCDEAAVVDWERDALPDWPEAEAKMRTSGRVSRVSHPSPAHARGETVPTP